MAGFITLKPPPGTDYSRLKTTIVNTKTAVTNNALFQSLTSLTTAAETFQQFVNSSFQTFTGGFNSVSDSLTQLFQSITLLVEELKIRNSFKFGVSSYNSSVDSVPTGVDTALTYDTDIFNTGNMRNGTKLFAPIGAQYLVTGQVVFASTSSAGQRTTIVKVNGGSLAFTMSNIHGETAVAVTLPFSVLLQLAAEDYVEVYVNQNSGGNLNVAGAVQMVRISYAA